jgi:Tfp pilus assembly protein PilO
MLSVESSLVWLNRSMHALASVVCLLLLAAGGATGQWLSTFADDNRGCKDAALNCLARKAEIQLRRDSLCSELHGAKSEVAALEARLPQGPREAELIAQLADLGKASGLEINSFRPGHKAEHSELCQLELRLSANGPFSGLCTFLSDLPTLPRLCHVGGLELSPLDEAGTAIAAELQLNVLFRNQFAPPLPRSETNHAE